MRAPRIRIPIILLILRKIILNILIIINHTRVPRSALLQQPPMSLQQRVHLALHVPITQRRNQKQVLLALPRTCTCTCTCTCAPPPTGAGPVRKPA